MYDQNERVLYHYGVKGMRWGVRNDRSRAYSKSVKQMRKLKDKEEIAYEKEIAANKEHLDLLDKLVSTGPDLSLSQNTRAKRFNKSRNNSAKATEKSAIAQKKARDWFDKMSDEFANVKLEDVSSEDLKYMKELTEYYMVYDAVMYKNYLNKRR